MSNGENQSTPEPEPTPEPVTYNDGISSGNNAPVQNVGEVNGNLTFG